MIIGVGIDTLAVDRMRRELARPGAGFRDIVFTPREIARCDAARHPAGHYAARFAAKEALFKALPSRHPASPPWKEIEIVDGSGGGPEILLHGSLAALAGDLRVARVHVSLSTARDVAAACVVLESREGGGRVG